MTAPVKMPVGVVLMRERIGHPWQEYAWRAVEVLTRGLPVSGWQPLREEADISHFYAGPVDLVLHRNETAGYYQNLSDPEPCIYVILRERDGEPPLDVHLVTPSPSEVQAYGDSGSEIVDRLPMPDDVYDLVAAFVAEHYEDEPFVKRKRQKFHAREEHKFGQEPLVELRQRMAAAASGDDDDQIG